MTRRAVSLLLALVLTLSLCTFAYAEDDWGAMPTITHVFEFSKEKVALEWEGSASLYHVYVDGKTVATVNINSAIVPMKAGNHQIVVVPVKYEPRDVDTRVEINIAEYGGGSIDLAALGINPKDLVQGTPSKTCKFSYSVNPIYKATPKVVGACTDFDDNVLLTITDNYEADSYKVIIKRGKDVSTVEFDASNILSASLISKANSSVTITLDQNYLRSQGCLVPELDQKYSFSVQLQKHPINSVTGKKEYDTLLSSKESKAFSFTPFAAWKNAPEISYASQTADGEITLQWEHGDGGMGCEYRIVRYNYFLGIKKGETELGRTDQHTFTVRDLMNGKYTFAVIPLYSREEGAASEAVEVEIKNSWVSAPSLSCSIEGESQVALTWTSIPEVESYHIVVSAGSGSLLRFVNLDYKLYTEFDVPAKAGSMDMEYLFTYKEPIPESGVRLKFEIYGVRRAANGAEQKSATTRQTIILP